MRLILLLIVLLALPALADDTEKFKSAWSAFSEALETDDSDLKIAAAKRVVDVGKQIFDEGDERLAVITHNYGGELLDGGHNKEATKILKEAVRLGELTYGDDSIELIGILADLADAEAEVYDPDRQIKHYRRALKIAKNYFGADSPEYADVAFRMSTSVYIKSSSSNATKYLKEARAIYSSLPEPMTRKVGLSDFYLGKMAFANRAYSNAAKHLESALGAFEGPSDANRKMRLTTRALLVRTYESSGKTDLATEHCVGIGRESQFSPNQEYEPLFRMAPRFPMSMLQAGSDGHVILEFTVDESGFVQNPVVAESVVNGKPRERTSDFGREALKAVSRFRYAPRFEEGVAVAVDGVQTRISFEYQD